MFQALANPAVRLSALAPVAAIVPPAAKVSAVAEVVIVSIEATPVKAPPVVTFNPEPAVKAKVVPARAKVPVEFPIVVDADPVELIKVVPKTVVEPLIALVPPETPKVLAAEVPVPKELVKEGPVPIVEFPEEVRVVKDPAPPEIPPEPVIVPSQLKAPAVVMVQPVEPKPPAKLMLPVEVPAMLTAPEVPASRVILVPAVEAEIAGLAPEKVNAVLVKVLEL